MKRDFKSHLYLGNHYKELKDYEKAEHHYKIAKSIAPSDPDVLTHLCAFCHHMHKFDLAEKCAELAVKNLKVPDEKVYLNYALILGDKGETEKSQYYYYKAISANPKNKEALFGLGMEQVRIKKYVLGWKNYEARLECHDHLKEINIKYKVPYWDGSPNKKVVLYSDQGMGDIIFGIRYLPELAYKNINFYLDNDMRISEVFTLNKFENQEVDCCCSIMSLPHLVNPEKPCNENYKLYFKHHNYQKYKKKIGIIFAGNHEHANDYKRSIHLSKLKPIFEKYDCYLLQKIEHMTRWHMSRLVNLYDCEFEGEIIENKNLKDTLDSLYNLDCLVTVDTGIAHLAGAINMTTYVLLDYSPDFRWGRQGENTVY